MDEIEKIYHCCRFCHYYDNERCNHENTFATEDRDDYVDSIYQITEQGYVHDAIKEVVDADKITEIIRAELSETRLSKKAIEQIVKTVAEKVDETVLINWIPDITDAVQDVYIDHIDDNTTLCTQPCVVDPHTFYCRYFQ